jgi:4a-hydroxytetrahydrobiopterin dehydratase
MAGNATQLAAAHCSACEGKTPRLTASAAEQQLGELSGWRFTADGSGIRKDWQVEDFAAGIDFFDLVAELADTENHHPDLHLEGYRNVRIELSTHAVGGLTQNDFILAAKIDRLPIGLRR